MIAEIKKKKKEAWKIKLRQSSRNQRKKDEVIKNRREKQNDTREPVQEVQYLNNKVPEEQNRGGGKNRLERNERIPENFLELKDMSCPFERTYQIFNIKN